MLTLHRFMGPGLSVLSGAPRSLARSSRPCSGARTSPSISKITRLALAISATLTGAVWHVESARAQQAYPARPITMIVPFAAGGTVDVVGRVVGDAMSRNLGQQVIVENVIGAGGTTAAIRAAPDGYTVMLGHMGTHGAMAALNPHLAYNPSVDFAPIGLLTGSPVFLVVNKETHANTLAEFIEFETKRGAEGTMAHAGFGSVSHVSCELLNSITGLKPKLVAFQGSDPAIKALASGKVDYMCDQAVSVVPQAKMNSVRVLAIASPRRNPALPDVPTAREAGLPAFDVIAWTALFAPRDTPEPIVTRLNEALNKALDDPSVRKRLMDLGSEIPEPDARRPQVLAATVKAEVAKWLPFFSHEGEVR